MKFLYYTEDGFTLIESMMALALFSIGMLAITSIIISSSKTIRSSAITDNAIFETSNEISRLVLSNNSSDIKEGNKSENGLDVKWAVTDIDDDGDTITDFRAIKFSTYETDTGKLRMETFYVVN